MTSVKKTNIVGLVFCQFCGISSRAKNAANWFIVGIVDRVCICSDCVGICNDIIAERSAQATAEPAQTNAVDPVPRIVAPRWTREKEI